jgi:hypothetical protein
MPSTKTPKSQSAPKPLSKNQFGEQDLLEAQTALQAIKAQPSFTRRQLVAALQNDCLDALARGASTSQLTEVLEKLSIPIALSALVNLQRMAKKRSTSPGTPGPVGAT